MRTATASAQLLQLEHLYRRARRALERLILHQDDQALREELDLWAAELAHQAPREARLQLEELERVGLHARSTAEARAWLEKLRIPRGG